VWPSREFNRQDAKSAKFYFQLQPNAATGTPNTGSARGEIEAVHADPVIGVPISSHGGT
jgi:hypothetical protein